MQKSKVLIVGSGITAHQIYKNIENKYKIFVCGKKNDDFSFPKKVNHLKIDYKNKLKILNLCNKQKIEYIIPDGNEVSYLTCSFIAKKLKLKGFEDYKNTKILHNKKNFLSKISSEIKFPKIINIKKKIIDYPIIVKPVNLHSGIGIEKIDDMFSLKRFLKKRKNIKKKYYFSKFIYGELFSHSILFNENKKINFYVKEEVKNYKVIKSYAPYSLSKEIKKILNKNFLKIIKKFKLKNGVLHLQYIINKKKPYLIEVTRRAPGDFYGLLIDKAYGYNYYLNYANIFLNQKISLNKNKNKNKTFFRKTIFDKESLKLIKKKSKFFKFYRSYKKNRSNRKIGVSIYH